MLFACPVRWGIYNFHFMMEVMKVREVLDTLSQPVAQAGSEPSPPAPGLTCFPGSSVALLPLTISPGDFAVLMWKRWARSLGGIRELASRS